MKIIIIYKTMYHIITVSMYIFMYVIIVPFIDELY